MNRSHQQRITKEEDGINSIINVSWKDEDGINSIISEALLAAASVAGNDTRRLHLPTSYKNQLITQSR